MLSISESLKKEEEVFENYKKNNPELFVFDLPVEKEILSRIGINTSLPFRYQGYMRLYLQDFIVEEVLNNKDIVEIKIKVNEIPCVPPLFTLYANLVKSGISTTEAINSIAETIRINSNKIGYAGLKDVKALTSQRISFPNINSEIFEKIKKIYSPKFFLTDFTFGKGSINSGELFGNRFTILIRTKENIDNEQFSQNLDKIKKEGFLNFFQSQRFGTPRYLSHFFGKLILQGKYEEAVFAFLTYPGLREIPLIKLKRKEAEEKFGDWIAMEKIFSEFPYTFRNELRLLSYLKENPKNFIGALIFFKDQTTIWIYAYTSYLFNQLISIESLELPEKIPLFLSADLRDERIYKFWLEKDNVYQFREAIKPFKFLRLKRNFIKTIIFPQNLQFKNIKNGVILNFILEKGVYATTFLMNFFEIHQGLPLPDWVDIQEYDTKELLKIGSIKPIKDILDIDSPKINRASKN